jgi:hypothetical protein
MPDYVATLQDLETVRNLLDTINGTPHGYGVVTESDRAAALTKLTDLVCETGLHTAVLEMLISGALFRMRNLRDSSFVPQIIQQVKAAKNPASMTDIDTAAFFPTRAGKALEKLTDIPEILLWLFKRAAANDPERPKRRRQRKPADTQPAKTNESESL